GRTQGGNNNAYCQDDEISWFDWDAVDTGLLDYTRELIRLRRETPALRGRWYRGDGGDGSDEFVLALRADGRPMAAEDWQDENAKAYGVQFGATDSASVLLLVNAAETPVEFGVPTPPHGPWQLAMSSDPDQEVGREVEQLLIGDHSTTVLRSAR
ncbi:MAG: hypothetical protein ACRYF3_07070, partial [Janthinobacterium lividum]